jgi:hypothetical protein
MDARGYFQSKGTYMNASHVQDGELNLTIGNVELEKMPRNDEEKIVIYFQEHERGLPLNKSNGDTLIVAFGADTADWVGGKVTVFKVLTKFDGEAREGVRLRVEPHNFEPQEKRTPVPAEATPTKKSLKDLMDDEVPF